MELAQAGTLMMALSPRLADGLESGVTLPKSDSPHRCGSPVLTMLARLDGNNYTIFRWVLVKGRVMTRRFDAVARPIES